MIPRARLLRNSPPMPKSQTLQLISSTTTPDLWSHPTLDLFAIEPAIFQPQKALLYSIPTHFGDQFDSDDQPRPTSALELPDIHRWTMSFAINYLEVLGGRRSPSQLASRTHHVIFMKIVSRSGSEKSIGRIQRIHQDQPLDGICESVVTVRFNDRTRSLVIRTEGVDGRWLCTALHLL